MQITLSGKTALVTGASRGIGRAIATRLAQAGANVGFTYKSSEDKALALQKELESFGVKALAMKADASSFSEAQAAVDATLSQLGGLHILVNNAGIARDGLLVRMSEAQWDEVIANNLKSAFNYAKAAARPMMQQRDGRIINITSVIGLMGNAGQANYAASKAGLIGFTKSLAKELASRNILVNAVAPGWIETDMTEGLNDELKKQMEALIPLKRSGKAEDVADAVLFLSSSLANYITGECLRVDGGMAM
ncbi:MAG: 3-oxoacyl-[acyl-carrier-protein] reductase [Chloroherpetonaceae bacterium]|nr:3-oxoacyl-[acyl-carrier-protein] reductase [Chloroherpetonaceae bacterium]MDW8437358.1 3-oxoacyl-[acyl-carrier-protein] reductase [Chloroherpetonaceae bacterium]